MAVTPPEQDIEAAITDAVFQVLEKDRFWLSAGAGCMGSGDRLLFQLAAFCRRFRPRFPSAPVALGAPSTCATHTFTASAIPGLSILLRRFSGPFTCQVAEHCWDPVGHAIVRYGYRFEGLIQARQREV
jgi:hypothetical protein